MVMHLLRAQGAAGLLIFLRQKPSQKIVAWVYFSPYAICNEEIDGCIQILEYVMSPITLIKPPQPIEQRRKIKQIDNRISLITPRCEFYNSSKLYAVTGKGR